MFKFTADFETTGDKNSGVRVWAWVLVDIVSCKLYAKGTNIETFFDTLKTLSAAVYFHNLKFDGEYLINHLLTSGYKHTDTKANKTFDTLITDDLKFYSITAYYKKLNRKYLKTTFYDSYKKLPFKVKKIAKDFKLPICKGEIDYDKPRPIGYEPDNNEWEYIVNDALIIAMALNRQFEQNLVKMTIGADALDSYKTAPDYGIGKEKFKKRFPSLGYDMWMDIKPAYKGGYCYLLRGGKRYKGINFDVNSLYPDRMYNCLLPYDYPVPFIGRYKNDSTHPLYIQRIRCNFELKDKHLPTIQLKNNWSFIQTEYLTTSKNSDGIYEYPEITLTNVDLKLFFEHYNIFDLEYIGGYKFRAAYNMFKEYIDYWMCIKETSEGALRALAKLMLNNLYGKYGTNPKKCRKTPYLDGDIVKYQREIEVIEKDVYIPIAAFITAYAREKTIRTAQKYYNRFIYSDTDSLKLIGYDIPKDLEIHDTKLGAWKFEGRFIDSLFLRAKTYIETVELSEKEYQKALDNDGINLYTENGKYYQLNVTCAGMNEEIKKQVTYNNFTYKSVFNGKLSPRRVKGGIYLEKTTFSIKSKKVNKKGNDTF